MIPKTIHYVWLSGDEKPSLVNDCIRSWIQCMPNYKIKEWSMEDIIHIDSPFLHDAISARKWAFATDYLRFYIIYHYGGIYMDSDVYTYRSFDPFLDSKGFTSLEGSGILGTEKSKLPDFGLEAAVFGAEKGSPWISHVLSFYANLRFVNKPSFYMSIMAPKVLWKQSERFGLRKVLSFQILDGDIRIYPLDTLSCVADPKFYQLTREDYKLLGERNPLRYACHVGSNSWGWQKKKNLKDYIKSFIIWLIGVERSVAIKRKVRTITAAIFK